MLGFYSKIGVVFHVQIFNSIMRLCLTVWHRRASSISKLGPPRSIAVYLGKQFRCINYKRWRAHHGEHTTIIDSEEIPEEYNEDDSDVKSEFEERNMELEEWLAEWMEKKELGQAARGLFSDET